VAGPGKIARVNVLEDVLAHFRNKTPVQIADMVRRAHIKGRTGTTTKCPLALLMAGIGTGTFVIGRKYIARRTPQGVQQVRTPDNVATFVRKFDVGGFPELMAPAPRCIAKTRSHGGSSGTRGYGDKRGHKRIVKHHLAKLVGRFAEGA